MKLNIWMIGVALMLAASGNDQASMRCASGLIDEGDTISAVVSRCGQPANRRVSAPAVNADGVQAYKSVTVEDWVYGPANGLYQYLRFIDGKLVSIRSARK
ncbi:DUF2845 domain-containing protein [Pseudomonas sp. 10B1]|uniref:DUF2845 domain-containing protein n=1 Tax=unclassified Pseudomonas TaxID=196821 RepID=UPI002AB457D9|nr:MULTISPECIES: DUF2845 domain-containing protein [unclassified Pseudomonas]MDY7562640.1 DUF2845 domain-containing protein [Pseudomonas sp. AB6]MEA9977443.1 DUF2845 domain-containing protein [Pseudomonas sp. RTS4]MEA9995840.1 DUF2845 domain-containing protein [Pseudomonas sp. AA4]MEB0087448.1 DUF2845 domain-containing protein [Pseudomonas sp. RTI1]MEB0127834.1 DUF2845 domain-containing protein [Pseudomonas sp. CCC1.2]